MRPSSRCSPRTRSRTSTRRLASSAEKGSSSSSTSGSVTSARASATRCSWPPDISPTRRPARSARRTSSSAFVTRPVRSRFGTPCIRSPKPTLSPTDRWGNSSGFWNTIATGRFSAGSGSTERSPKRTSPSSGSSSPATILSVVVLPQPLGPSRAVREPGSTTRSTRSTAGTPAYALDRPLMRTGVLTAAQPDGRRAAAGEEAGGQRDEQERRQDEQHRERGGEGEVGAADVGEQQQGQRLHGAAADEQREDVLAPGDEEGEEGGDDERRPHHGQGDVPEGAQRTGPEGAGLVLVADLEVGEGTAEHQGHVRDGRDELHQDHAWDRAGQPVPQEEHADAERDREAGDDRGGEQQELHQPLAAEGVQAERAAGGQADAARDGADRDPEQQRGQQPASTSEAGSNSSRTPRLLKSCGTTAG